MSEFDTYSCPGCDAGIGYCKSRPCWGTPEEIKRIRAAGFGHRLMTDWWEGDSFTNGETVLMSQPALVGCEDKRAPQWPRGRCTFLTAEDKCELHDLGLKPLEGRTSCCKSSDDDRHVRRHIVRLWMEHDRQ